MHRQAVFSPTASNTAFITRFLRNKGHDPDGHQPFAADVGGNAAAHDLWGHIQAHAVGDGLTDLSEFVVSQPGVDFRGGIEGEVSEGPAGKEGPEIYGDLDPDGLAPPDIGDLLLLHILQGHHEGRAEEGGEADLIFVSLCQDLSTLKAEAGQIQEAVQFPGASGPPGGVFLPAGVDVPAYSGSCPPAPPRWEIPAAPGPHG